MGKYRQEEAIHWVGAVEEEGAVDKEVVLCTCSRSLKPHPSARRAPVGAFSSAARPPLMYRSS